MRDGSAERRGRKPPVWSTRLECGRFRLSPGVVAVSHEAHKATAPVSVGCAVLTISDTRTEATDRSGRTIADLLAGEGHRVVSRAIVPDEPDEVRATIARWLEAADIDVVITTGGTGIAPRDGTYEVVAGLIEKRLDGFGELFRWLSYQDIGSAAMLSRACAGTAGRSVIVALPGSERAVRLAMTSLVLPELGHLVGQLRGPVTR